MSLMAAQMGLGAIRTLGAFTVSRTEAKMAENMNRYRAAMAGISATRALNAVTTNQQRLGEQAAQQNLEVQRMGMQDAASAEVAAAAAGVAGGSVDAVFRDLSAAAESATFTVQRNARRQMQELQRSRTDIRLSQLGASSPNIIPKPSAGSLLLGLGTQALSIWDSHQPEGQRIGDIGARQNT